MWTSKAGDLFVAGKSVAVVIGISNYMGPPKGGYQSLPTARFDAIKMKRFLLEDAVFDVVYLLTDEKVTKERIERLMIDQIPREVGPVTNSCSTGRDMAIRWLARTRARLVSFHSRIRSCRYSPR